MKYKVSHTTTYQYEQPTTLSYNEAWMFPRPLPYQIILDSKIAFTPNISDQSFRTDFFGNKAAFFSIHIPHNTFNIEIETRLIRNIPENLNPQSSQISWNQFKAQLEQFKPENIEIKQFAFVSPVISYSDELKIYALESFKEGRPLYEAILELNTRIYKDFQYIQGLTSVATPLSEIVKTKKGVCQDFAHFAIGCLRSIGLPAKYVSGYIETNATGEDAQLIGVAASHAWFSAYIPEMGWVDFDPTNNQVVKDRHITVAWGRDYSDIPPLKGVIFNSANHELSVKVNVERLSENDSNMNI